MKTTPTTFFHERLRESYVNDDLMSLLLLYFLLCFLLLLLVPFLPFYRRFLLMLKLLALCIKRKLADSAGVCIMESAEGNIEISPYMQIPQLPSERKTVWQTTKTVLAQISEEIKTELVQFFNTMNDIHITRPRNLDTKTSELHQKPK